MRLFRPAAVATLAIVALLVVFHQVVRGAAQGELRRKAVAAQVEAAWGCNAPPGLHVRDTCPPLLDPVGGDDPRHRPAAALAPR